MGCCSGEVEPEKTPNGDVVLVDQIRADRKCTDLLFLLLFFLFWVGMLIVGFTGFSEGNVNRLLYGIDYHANLCGQSNSVSTNGTANGTVVANGTGADFSNREQLFYYDLTSLASSVSSVDSLTSIPVSTLKTVCVNGCPTDFIPYDDLMGMLASASFASSSELLVDSAMSSIKKNYAEYMDDKYWYCEYYKYTGAALAADVVVDEWSSQYFANLSNAEMITSIKMVDGPCYPTYLKFSDFINYCVPSIPQNMVDFFNSKPPPPPGNSTTAPPPPENTTSSPTATSSSDATSAPTAGNSTDSSEFASAEYYDNLKTALNYLTDARDYLETYITDIYKGWAVILVAGVLGGVVLSMIWMTVIRYAVGFMAWGTLLFINLLFIMIAVFCALKAGLIDTDNQIGDQLGEVDSGGVTDVTDNDKKVFEVATYITVGLAVVVFLFTLLLAKRIKVAIAVLKVASQAVSTMPMILFFPLVQFAMLVGLMVWWIAVVAGLYSAGDVSEKEGGGYDLAWDETLRYMMLYHLFGLLWTNQFIVGFGLMVVAGAIANFYWTAGDTNLMPAAPVMGSMRRTARYHLGSIALGSFLVAVIQFIRLVLEYIDRKTKNMQEANPIYKYLMCIVKCCMWYLEKIMKFINRNAYIMVAIKGKNFCKSAITAVALLVENVLRLAAVNIVGDSLIFLGKLMVMLGAGVIAFLMTDLDIYTDPAEKTYLSSPLMPIILSCLIAFFIADIFFQVYEMAVDTILLSFCEDCSQNDDHPKFAPPLLAAAIGQSKELQSRGKGSVANHAPGAEST
mmetsp:Transcript_19037/g.31987  ORF Transcript_19037/g.31987 Transcript_19037/m.31987 type:complete len:792 (+) Transcript_19037:213-2588(+)|eukprot:CAMPEP_0198205400 /NCGR_PEP_ID=MMETSP1445-20131203/8941_1 /TAXON_ID=36898 /ORGANISM="Pyramimonas sp., Strain CCMP2087" /LENGTH=791 /DNA_ID=CAMNT_0043877695 /DNA_START=190 /DNA_END=2565 /DNA_ORIENTATION=+